MNLNPEPINLNTMERVSATESFHCSLICCENRSFHYHLHWHTFIEMLFIRRGYLTTTLRNNRFVMKEEELLVVLPGELHSSDYDGENILEYICIKFDPIILHSAIPDSNELANYLNLFSYRPPYSFLFNSEETRKARIPQIFNNIYKEICKKETGYTLLIQSNLLKIIVWLLRRWNHDSLSVSGEESFSIYKRILPALSFIQEQYTKDISTTEMAGIMSMSVPHFCRLFKRTVGCSFRGYLRSLRIAEAINLLFTTDYNISQIASQVGYEDPNFFIRVFRKQTGLSPLQYKNSQIFPPSHSEWTYNGVIKI